MLVSSVREMFPTREEGGEKVTDLRRDAYFYKLDSLAHDTLLPLTGTTKRNYTGDIVRFHNKIYWMVVFF